MRRAFFIFCLTLLGLYLGLHLVLGSSPVQKRVLAGLQAELAKFDLDLQMEGIEFSPFSPKIYLNQVTLTAGPRALINLPHPLTIDKIKIQFQPIALLYRHLVIEELILFHPRILIPDANALYQKVQTLLSSKKNISTGSSFSVIFRKVGVVDALISIDASQPAFSFRTRSLSAFLQMQGTDQRSLSLQSNHIELKQNPLALSFSRVDIDVDMVKKSLRLNKAILESEPLSLNLKGISTLPLTKEKGPDAISLSYEIQVALPILNQWEKFLGGPTNTPEKTKRLPSLTGRLSANGNIRRNGEGFSGNGSLHYDGLSISGYRIGKASLSYGLTSEHLELTNTDFNYSGGHVLAKKIVLGFKEPYPLTGELSLEDIELAELLEGLKITPSPVRLKMGGKVSVSGQLASPFQIRMDADAQTKELLVLRHRHAPVSPENQVLKIKEGGIKGLLTFTTERFSFDTVLNLLGSSVKTDGYVSIGDADDSLIKLKGENISLTELKNIAELEVAGMTTLTAQVDVRGNDVKIAGTFDARDAEISELSLGSVKGDAYYQNDLLSFENLEIPAIEPLRGTGFVDFKPSETHYRFSGDAPRIEMNQVFGIFRKNPLSFAPPREGEIDARFTIEGGHDAKGIEVASSGQAKAFSWYGEKWVSANYHLKYRKNDVDLDRLLLLKKTGALEIKAKFGEKTSHLEFLSRQLLIEELDYFRGSSVKGEIAGALRFNGNESNPFLQGNGDVKVTKTVFRGSPLPDTQLKLVSAPKRWEINGAVAGEHLKGKFVRSPEKDEIQVGFQNFDFTPLMTLAMGKDIPSINHLTATGEVSMEGNLAELASLNGKGSVSKLDLGFRGSPMTNGQPIQVEIEKGKIKVSRFQLESPDSQLSMDLSYEPKKKIQASMDAKLDLQVLQPFIPGLEYGTGKVAVGLRVSGLPSQYELLGNATLDDGFFRITGLRDEFRSTKARFSISHDRMNFDRFETTVNGGIFTVGGDIRINRFQTFAPNLTLHANKVGLNLLPSLFTRFSGDFFIRGSKIPYALTGTCHISESVLTEFGSPPREPASVEPSGPILTFDVTCDAKDHLLVKTEMMEAEFKGNFHLLGNTDRVGLLGSAEAIKGTLIFKDTRFNLVSGTVRFESPNSILPRFSVSGQARIREQKLSRLNVANAETDRPQEYEVTLLVFGTPSDYKIRLSSSPSLPEGDIISLLVLGVTSRGQEGNYVDLGSALVGQIPLQSKIQNEFGLDIRLKSQTPTELQQINQAQSASASGTNAASGRSDVTVPSVQIQKEITKKTRVSFSNTLEATPTRELRLEQMLDENLSVNATVERSQIDSTQQPSQSYGLDFRYRFHFE